METCERRPLRERLLDREQINAITDIEWLEGELDNVTTSAKHIEVDLEFRSDDFATDDWEHRARGALAAHHVCQGHLTRRIAFLKRGERKGPTPVELQDAKARKREAEAARLTAAAEHKRLKAAEEREKTLRQLVAYASRQSLLLHFQRAAQEELDRETYARLMAVAHRSLEASLLADLPRDSGSGPEGENSRSEVEGEAPQSGLSASEGIAQSPIEDPTP